MLGNVSYAQKLARKMKAAKAFSKVLAKDSKVRRGLMKTPVRPLMDYSSTLSGKEMKGRLDIPVLIGLKAKEVKTLLLVKQKWQIQV